MDPGSTDSSKKTNPVEPPQTGPTDHDPTKPELSKDRDTSCSSSDSSDSSDDDFFQLDPTVLSQPPPPVPKPSFSTANRAHQHDDEISLRYLTGKSGGRDDPPPVQVMGRADVPDPNRIPSSVFARTKSTTPMEWSVASNESLFSIHMGNSSFSRDHVFLMGKSGELSGYSGSPMDIAYSPPPAPEVVSVVGSGGSGGEVGEGLGKEGATAATNAEAMKDVLRAAAEEHAIKKEKVATEGVTFSASISRHSDGSTTSFRSFAFPILTEGRSGSMKVNDVEHQQAQSAQLEQHSSQVETPKIAPPPATATEAKGWFSCLSCCPFCR